MGSYRIVIKRSAAREIEKIGLTDRRRIISKIRELATNPRPAGCKKLSGQEKYRIRQGDYRILYLIDGDQLIIVVVKVGHRRDAYKN
jgi:mRNA interferase RelE/StbE